MNKINDYNRKSREIRTIIYEIKLNYEQMMKR